MIKKNNMKAWLYLAPALIFLCVFMLYPLVDVFVYSFEENYKFTTAATGVGFANYNYILGDEYFLQAIRNTFILVIITVPLSTTIALLLSVALNAIKPLRKFFETLFFLPYVTNTLAVGLVFMIMFKYESISQPGLINKFLALFGIDAVNWIEGPYWAKMFVLCFYTIWVVMPFKILILVGALQSVRKEYYQAAQIDGASKYRVFRKITIPMISPMISYLVITGFIGAFKAYQDAVAIFGEDLNDVGMNTMVGYVYNMLYASTGGYPSYASAAAIVLFSIVLTITVINLLVSKKKVQY